MIGMSIIMLDYVFVLLMYARASEESLLVLNKHFEWQESNQKRKKAVTT